MFGDDPSKEYIQTSGTSLTNRNFKQSFNGSNVVAVYEEVDDVEEPEDPEPEPDEPEGPIAAFRNSPNSPNADQDVCFKDESTHPDDLEIVEWSWSIDDKTFTEQEPCYQFPGEGNYDVTLEITDENGLTDSVTNPVQIAEENLPPTTRINGPNSVKVGDRFTVRTFSNDPNGNDSDNL